MTRQSNASSKARRKLSPTKAASKAASKPANSSRRKSPEVPSDTEPTMAAVTSAAPVRIYRPSSPKPSTPSARRAAQNIVDAAGGPTAILAALDASISPKAKALADRLRDPEYATSHLYTNMAAVGLRHSDLIELLGEPHVAAALIEARLESREIIGGIVDKAKDKIVRHSSCRGTGRTLDPETQLPTDIECWSCEGTGWELVAADKDSVELWMKLVDLHKSAPQTVINAQRQTQINNSGQMAIGTFGVSTPGAAPDVTAIIRRADEREIVPINRQLSDGSGRIPEFPSAVGSDEEEAMEPTEAEVSEAEEV